MEIFQMNDQEITTGERPFKAIVGFLFDYL